MTTEQEFLARVAGRLRRSSPLAERPGRESALPLPEYGPTDPDALADRFQAELEKLSGKVYRASTPADVARFALEILQGAGLQGIVVRWDDPTLEGLGLDGALAAAGYAVVPFSPGASGLVPTAERAVAGITGCDAAIAETGTLVMGSHRWGDAIAPGRGRVVSLLPPLHIAIVQRERLVYSALSVFRRLAGSGPLPAQVIFASGPSRSADIENDLSIGVHGPGQEHVIIL